MAFDPDAYLASKSSEQKFDPDAYLAANKAAPPSGGVWSDFGKETAKAFMSGYQHLHPAPVPPDTGTGFWSGMLNEPIQAASAGAARLGAPIEMLTSPVTGAIHAFGGRGLAGLESYAGEAAQSGLQRLGLARPDVAPPDRQAMYEQAKADIDKALAAAMPPRTGVSVTGAPWGGITRKVEADIAAAGGPTKLPSVPKAPPPLSESERAQQELRDAGVPVDIPRALTIENPVVQAGSVALSKTPWAGAPLGEAIHAAPAQMGAGIETLADKYGAELPENIVGGGVQQTLSEAARREAATQQAVAQGQHAEQTAAWEQENQARETAITGRQAQATNAAARAFGHVHPIEAAEDTTHAVQAAHNADEAANQQNWRAVNNIDAHVETAGFHNLHERLSNDISDAGVTLDPENTPNAWRMMAEARRLSAKPGELPPGVPPRLLDALEREYGKGQVPAKVLDDLGFPGATPAQDPNFRLMGEHAPAPGATSVPVQGMEMLRKRIGDMAFDAVSPTDRRASNAIKSAFGDWYGDTLENHLTPGSNPAAQATIDRAIASHREFRERFGYNRSRLAGENKTAAGILNRMATGDIGPEDVRRNLIGAKPGTRGVSAPLHDAILNAVDNPAAVRGNIRGAYWHDMTEGHTPATIASNVRELVGAPGEWATRMGRTLFEPHEHDLMRGYAQLSQQTPEHLAEAARIAKQTKPKLIEPEPGRAQQLASQMLGRNRSDEQVFDTFDRALRSNIKLAARTWGAMSETNRNEVRGAWLRNMGGEGEDFSVAKFIKNWESYPDQAKAIMLGREHRQSMQNFYTLAKQYGATLSKYGNPSGTAQVSAWHKLASGALKTAGGVMAGGIALFHPIGIAIAGLGLRKIANILAVPKSAAELSKWGRVAQAYKDAPSTTKLVALSNLSRTLNATGD